MTAVVSFIRQCLAKGMSLDDALTAAEIMEAQPTPRSKAAERTARWRERKEASQASRVTVGDGRDACDGGVTVNEPKTSMKSQASVPAHVRELSPNLENNHHAVAVVVEARATALDDWPAGDAHAHLRRLVMETGSPRLDPTKAPGLITTLGRLAAWRRDGASWEHEVVPVITTIARKRGPPINTWKFFDAAIAQSIADNRKALTIPEASDVPSSKRSQREANLARAFAGAEAAAQRRRSP